MPETNVPKTHRHVTSVTITDGTPQSYLIPVRGSLTYTPGGYAEVDIKDFDGSFTGVSPTKGDEQFTTLTITATERGIPGQPPADICLADFLNHSGDVPNWISTGTETSAAYGDLIAMVDIIVTLADHTGTSTITFPGCTIIGSSINSTLDGNVITISAKSRAAYPTTAFA